MKRFVLFYLFFNCTVLLAQDDVKISWDYSGMTFTEFAEKAEITDSLRFFYRDEWVDGLKLGQFNGPVPLTDLLDSLFRSDSLYYYREDPGFIYVTKGFAIKVHRKKEEAEKTYIKPIDYELEIASQQAGNIFFQIGDRADRNIPGLVTLSGYITDKDTREPVPGATVYVEKQSRGTLSSRYGYYSLMLPRGSHQIRFSFIGMKERIVNADIYRSGEMNIEMSSTLVPLRETVITAERNVVLQRTEVGVEKIDISTFRMMPTSMGETDIIKSVLLVTGVQTIGEGSMGFNVRGGSADQNLILLYGAPVYNSSHFFGFFSSVNSDIIKEATLYKGGMPARYGGRISSVLDIAAREGNRKELFGNAGISPVTTHFLLEGPIKKDTGSFILTGRTTYSNWLMHLIQDKAIKRSRADFYDLNAKAAYDINKNNRIDFSSYLSHDGFRFNSDTLYTYNNRIIAVTWRHFFHSRFLSTVSINNSDYNYNISSTSHPPEAFTMSHRINSTGLRADFNMYGGRHEINYGIDITRYAVNPGTYLPASDSSNIAGLIIPEEKALEGSLYLEDKIALNENISFVGGIRLSSFLAYGEKTVMLYDPRVTRSESSITDSLKFGKGDISESYFGPEFRASVNIRTTDISSVKINYNRTRQHLHLLSNTVSISPTDTWKLCD